MGGERELQLPLGTTGIHPPLRLGANHSQAGARFIDQQLEASQFVFRGPIGRLLSPGGLQQPFLQI